MFLCRIRHFEVVLDDVWYLWPSGRCVCVRCYHHEIADEEPMPKALRHEVEVSANGA